MQHRFFPAPPFLALGALLLGAALCPPPASAAIDLLTLPALQSPKAARGMLLAIAGAGERLVAVGERGIIVFSDDHGANWKQARVPVSLTLTCVFFATREVGWAAGHDGVILRSTDAGATWHKQFDGTLANALVLADLKARLAASQKNASDGERLRNALADAEGNSKFGPSPPLLGLWFGDADKGLAVGAFGQLFQTVDGGKSWATLGGRIDNLDGLHFNSIAEAGDGSLLIAGEGGKLRRSRDRGANWETLDTGYAGHLYGALAPPGGGGKIVAFGFGGTVLLSNDNGKSWQSAPKLVNKSLVAGFALPDGALVLAAGDGQLLLSRDQGATFELIKDGAGRPVAALLPRPLRTGRLLAVGGGGARTIALGGKAP